MARNPSQLQIPYYQPYLVPAGLPKGTRPDSHVSVINLTARQGVAINFGQRPTWRDLRDADPLNIKRGLLAIPFTSYDYDKDHHVVRNHRSQPGVAFPPEEFPIVARSPGDLARSLVVGSARKQKSNPKRSEARQTGLRAGGHGLEEKVVAQTSLITTLQSQHDNYGVLSRHLADPRIHPMKANASDKLRGLADERLHDSISVAVIHLELGDAAINALHRTWRRRVYDGNYSSAERTLYLIRSLKLLKEYTTARADILVDSKKRAEAVLNKYQPALDANKDQESAEAQPTSGQAA